MAAVCRELGVDFAHGMAGFDVRGGRSIPIILGVVVCEEFGESVMEAWTEAERYEAFIISCGCLNVFKPEAHSSCARPGSLHMIVLTEHLLCIQAILQLDP